MGHITVGFAAHSLLELLEELGTESFEESTKFFVNGCWVGIHRDLDLLVNILRQFRRQVLELVCFFCAFSIDATTLSFN
ncbi:hypothetical protein B296_00041267 [Ensete ventricosum]|uniref:Uncharacterized protein n=1 Tax=Ensete ventricosum TaxID=4639 RepID=A0A426ZMD4_ENSVE|nr:hypothetical protein B296_00041267 [Ensete ventricosum]